MSNISQVFANHIDSIFEQWKERVRYDRKIDTARDLSETALGNSVPKVLEAMVTALSLTEEDDFEKIVSASLEHGSQRFQQGFDPKEITREYRLLRQVIFTTLESDLLQLSPQGYNRAFRLIDAVIDEASAQCFQRYAEEQKQTMEQLLLQLMMTNQELERLLQTNQNHLSQLAHELKTPLNAIMGHSQLLLRRQQARGSDDTLSVDQIERVLRSSRQLLQLVNGALEFSRLEAGKSSLKLVETNIAAVMGSVIEIIEPLAQTKDLRLTVNDQAAPAAVITDTVCLRQILTNLLSNAVRYTDQGSVTVSCVMLPDGKWSLTVSDTGIGIAPEDHSRVFEPFSRASSDRSPRREDSTGLGLAIVHRLVQLLQGEIELTSNIGEGSKFTVTFPVDPGQT